jgi:glyoxylase-like metal-dependent hydrolase (beta-lactamase superfamily II)
MIRPAIRRALPLALLPLLLLFGPARGDIIRMGLPPKPYKPGLPDTTISISVTPLAPGVYAAKVSYVWTGWVELPDGILVVDTGFSMAAGHALADTIRARSGKLPIRTVVNTHDHDDHTGGDRYFAALGARFVAHSKWAADITHQLTWTPGEFGDTLTHLGITPKVGKLTKKLALGTPKRPVQVIWLGHPGHTAADLVVYLPKEKILFAGDLVSNKSIPWLLDPDMQVKGWLACLDSLLTPAFTIEKLVPGHGEIGEKPIDEIQFTNHYLLDARKKASEVASWGTSLNSVRDWGYLGAYEGMEFYDEVHFINMKRLYNEAKGIKTPGRKYTRVIKTSSS